MAGFIYDRYGFRCEVTAEAIELRAWRPFGRSQKTFIPLMDVQQVFVKWTGLVSIITRAGLEYRVGSGASARDLAQAIRDAAAAAGTNVTIVIGADPRRPPAM